MVYFYLSSVIESLCKWNSRVWFINWCTLWWPILHMPDTQIVYNENKRRESSLLDNFMQKQQRQQQQVMIEMTQCIFDWTRFVLNHHIVQLRHIRSFRWILFGFTHHVKKSSFYRNKIRKFTWTPVNRNSTKWNQCSVCVRVCVCMCFEVNAFYLLVCMPNKMCGIPNARCEM